jgi:hypothetical protein
LKDALWINWRGWVAGVPNTEGWMNPEVVVIRDRGYELNNARPDLDTQPVLPCSFVHFSPLSYDNGVLESPHHDVHKTRPATQRQDSVSEASSARMIRPL